MRAHPARHVLSTLVVVFLAALLGCAGRSQPTERPLPRNSYFISAERIAASGATTAWEALRQMVPIVHFRESRGRPARISRRGTASIYLDDQLRVIVDNIRVYDIKLLELMPAEDILTIEVLSGLDATTYYGASSTSGVIIIQTKTGSP